METNHAQIKDEEIKTVYKYRDWNNHYHKAVLIHNQIYIPSISELNDPFDFQLKYDFSLLNTDSKRELFIEHLSKSYPPNEKNRYKNILTENLNRQIEKFSEDFYKNEMLFFNKYCGTLCLSKVWDNILMWSHYSNNHSGICVGFNNNKLKDLFEWSDSVDYPATKNLPVINPLDRYEKVAETIIAFSHTKSIDWEYEKEYRYIKFWDPGKNEPTLQDRILGFDDSYIDEVILGLKISSDNEKEIRTICESRNIPVFKTKKSGWQFILERDRL